QTLGSNAQREFITVVVSRETLSESRQTAGTQSTAKHAIGALGSQERVTLIVEHLAIATVGIAVAIFADTVYRSHVAEVFDGTSRQQPVPGITPCGGPIRG